MSKRKIHIGNLQIRLPQSEAGQARAMAGGLGREVLQGMVDTTQGRTGTKRISDLSVGKLTITGRGSAQNLSQHIARRVADELRKKIE
jgi:hypothetical protein